MEQAPGKIQAPRGTQAKRRDIAVFALTILAVCVAMATFYFWPLPSGQRPTAREFVGFWARELLVLGVIIVAFAIAGISRLSERLRQREQGVRPNNSLEADREA
jgi:hypothetical protein